VLRVQLTAALPPGAKLTLTLELSGRLRVVSAGQTDLMSQGLAGLSQTPNTEQLGQLLQQFQGNDAIKDLLGCQPPPEGTNPELQRELNSERSQHQGM
ncbi:MAG: hypothetical protein RL701_3273, partial [Pseudomonadota bacterium]